MGENRHDRLLKELNEVASRVVSQVGLELVELTLRGSSRQRVLRVDIDRPGPVGVGIEDCKEMSGAIGEAIEQAQLLDSRYVLEVSSPGIDRPIRSDDDIRRNTGRTIVVETREPIDGRRSFRGLLLGSAEGSLRLREEATEEIRIPLDRVAIAKQDVTF